MFGFAFNSLNPWSETKNTEKKTSFYTSFIGETNFYLIRDGNKELRGNNCAITFLPVSDYQYSISVDPTYFNAAGSEKWVFPITGKEMNLTQDIPENSNSCIFELDLDKTNKIQFEFETDKDDYNSATKF